MQNQLCYANASRCVLREPVSLLVVSLRYQDTDHGLSRIEIRGNQQQQLREESRELVRRPATLPVHTGWGFHGNHSLSSRENESQMCGSKPENLNSAQERAERPRIVGGTDDSNYLQL